MRSKAELRGNKKSKENIVLENSPVQVSSETGQAKKYRTVTSGNTAGDAAEPNTHNYSSQKHVEYCFTSFERLFNVRVTTVKHERVADFLSAIWEE